MPYRDDAYWDPFAECWVKVTKPVVVDPKNPPLTDPNELYGDRYGVDWVYTEAALSGRTEAPDA